MIENPTIYVQPSYDLLTLFKEEIPDLVFLGLTLISAFISHKIIFKTKHFLFML